MQPWLAPVSNRLFGWTENGCEGTSPSAELRFQHSASPPSAAGRFPRRDTLPPRLPRARPPRPRPGPAPAAAPPRAGRVRQRPPVRAPAERVRAPPRRRCGSRAPGRGALRGSVRARFARCFPAPLRSVVSQAFVSFQPRPPFLTWKCTRLSATCPRLDFQEGETKGTRLRPGRHPSYRVDLNGSYLLERLQHLVFSLCPSLLCQTHNALTWSLSSGVPFSDFI